MFTQGPELSKNSVYDVSNNVGWQCYFLATFHYSWKT